MSDLSDKYKQKARDLFYDEIRAEIKREMNTKKPTPLSDILDRRNSFSPIPPTFRYEMISEISRRIEFLSTDDLILIYAITERFNPYDDGSELPIVAWAKHD